MKLAASILALTLCASLPVNVLASDRGGDSHPSSDSGSHSSSSSSSSSSDSRPAPAPAPEVRTAPAPVPEVHTAPAPAPEVHAAPAPDVRSAPIVHTDPITRTTPVDPGTSIHQPIRPPGAPTKQPLPIYKARAPVSNPGSTTNRPAPNPDNSNNDNNDDQSWDWNGGLPWQTQGYWGGGFWGQLAYGMNALAYIVAANSPGARLLQTYNLRQTPCGPSDLVEIIGPENSEICAYPNALVAPGVYYVDINTLMLYSTTPANAPD